MRRLLAGLVVVPLLLLGAPPAGAVTATDVVAVGSGTFLAPWSVPGSPSDFRMDATASGVVAAGQAVDSGAFSCIFGGSSASFGGRCSGTGVAGAAVDLECSFAGAWQATTLHGLGHCSVYVGGAVAYAPAVSAWTMVPQPFGPSFSATGTIKGAAA